MGRGGSRRLELSSLFVIPVSRTAFESTLIAIKFSIFPEKFQRRCIVIIGPAQLAIVDGPVPLAPWLKGRVPQFP